MLCFQHFNVIFLKDKLNDSIIQKHSYIEGMQKEDDENTGELLETNKNLSAAMDKLEQRCGMLDEKVNRLKDFKRMVKNSNSMQCVNCSKFISTRVFLQHLNVCAPLGVLSSS